METFRCLGVTVAVGLVAAVPAFAGLDADTMAFYTFKDGAPGTSAVGTPILNAVDGATHVGTPAVKDAGTHLGKVEFSADAPAKYIFSGMGGVPVATNAQSLFFDGILDKNENENEGGNVSFADIGSELSKCDEYTIEFFWKVDSNEVAGVHAYYQSTIFKPSVVCYDGTLDINGEPNGVKAVRVPSAPQNIGVLSSATVDSYQTESILYNGTYVGYVAATLLDGKWHHLAVTYSRTQRRRYVIADYTSAHCNASRHAVNPGMAVTNSVVETSSPLDLGNYIMRGRFACLRVTKRILAVSELLYASNDSRFYTDSGDVVFHWGLDGENGTAVSSIANRMAPLDFHVANSNLFYFSDRSIVSKLYTGVGTVVESTFDGVVPTYSNERVSARKTNVIDGVDKTKVIASNEGSARLSPPYLGGTADKLGFALGKNDFRHIPEGSSFTCECFYKIDFQATFDMLDGKSSLNHMVMSGPNAAYLMDWRMGFNISIKDATTNPQFDYIKPILDGYVRKADGSVTTQFNCFPGNTWRVTYGNPPFDEKWHHLAVVYDASTTNMTCYLDHKPWNSVTLPGHLMVRTPNDQNYIFGYGTSSAPTPIYYDEIRLTRKALAPSQFLHFASPQRGMQIVFR